MLEALCPPDKFRNKLSKKVCQRLIGCLPNHFLSPPRCIAWLYFPASPRATCGHMTELWPVDCGHSDECHFQTWPMKPATQFCVFPVSSPICWLNTEDPAEDSKACGSLQSHKMDSAGSLNPLWKAINQTPALDCHVSEMSPSVVPSHWDLGVISRVI